MYLGDMNITAKILLASLLALSAQYISDIVSFMAAALFADISNDYIQSTIVAIANVIISVLLFKYCALRWFRIDSSTLGLSYKSRAVIIASLSCILLFTFLFVISLPLTNEYSIANSGSAGIILYNSLFNRGISTAIGEELIFRGFLFSYILSLTKPSRAFIISILVFVLPHMFVFQPNLTSLLIFINYIAISLLLTTLYFKTKSISSSIAFHAVYNFILYGIWNVADTGESSSAIITSLMDKQQSDIFIGIFAICQLLATVAILRIRSLIANNHR